MKRNIARATMWAFGGIYLVGDWIYGIWYVWAHWAEVSWATIGTLVWYAFIRALIWPVWIVIAVLPIAADEWSEGAKQAYIERCTDSLSSQGLPREIARRHCSCLTRGMEREFGMKDYAQMMRAQPNSRGNSYDRRLYSVFKSCAHILPR